MVTTPASPGPSAAEIAPNIALVVHGHFYQPPRENPWTDEVSREPSATPFHDWNERISAECYRANAFARLHGANDRIRSLVNNYAHLSFNIGPTLARYVERFDPTTLLRMRAGNEEQRSRLGAGGALAQVWGHPIAPLLSPRDRRTQLAWGASDFQARFGHAPKGMWLPETAADPATLEALIEAGITYTILAPEQIAAVRPPGAAWKAVNRDTVDTCRPYKFVHGDGSGRSLAIAVFDGPLSREIAFGTATRDSESFLAAVKSSAARGQVSGTRLVLAASDGELYGHHKKFADLTLAHVMTQEAPRQGVTVTNLEAFFASADPGTVWELELAKGPGGEGTAWSCAHGLGRWQRHCGCAFREGWSQAWRTPLRAALDRLRDAAGDFYSDATADLFVDPWLVRDQYGTVIDQPPEARLKFLTRFRRPGTRAGSKGRGDGDRLRTLLLLEMQRATLAMYASCGWFFDDVAGIESALCIRQAAYAMDLWKELGGRPPTREVLDRLAEARSNMPHAGTGADVFRRVSQHRTTAAHAVAAMALSELSGQSAVYPHCQVAGFAVDHPVARKQLHPVVKGRAKVRNLRTGEEESLPYEASARSAFAPACKVGKTAFTLSALPEEAREPIALGLLSRLTAADKVSPREGRQALELARSVIGAGDITDPAFHELFAALLPRLLEGQPAERADAVVLEVITDVFEAVPEPARGEATRRLQEWLWQGLATLKAAGRPAPSPLRLLAEKAGFAPLSRS
jgi:alpha-amylase/alpha-mannosidase (GH57 family)